MNKTDANAETSDAPAAPGPMFKPRNAWSVRLFEPVAVPVVHLCLALRLSPNVVTVVSFVIAIGASVVFALVQGYWGLLLGALIFGFSFLFDLADGAVARMTGRVSPLGAWLDGKLDKVKKLACLSAILCTHWWQASGSWWWLTIGVILVVANYALQFGVGRLARCLADSPGPLQRRLWRRGVVDLWDPLDGQFVMLIMAPMCSMVVLPWVWGLSVACWCVDVAIKIHQRRWLAAHVNIADSPDRIPAGNNE